MPLLHRESDGSLTYKPSQTRAGRGDGVEFSTNDENTVFLVQFEETPFDQLEYTVYKGRPRGGNIATSARLGTYYYRVVAVDLTKATLDGTKISLDAGCPSIIVH
jgi:hypothetical protein